MSRKSTRLRETFVTYDGKPKKKSSRRWLIIMFAIMIVIIIGASYVMNHIRTIESAYNTNLYQTNLFINQAETTNDTDIPKPSKKAQYTFALIGLNNIEVDRVQLEDAQWASLWLVDTEAENIQQIILPTNVQITYTNQNINLNKYASEGLLPLVNQLASALETPIDYVMTVRMPGVRTIVEASGPIPITFEDRLVVADNDYFNGNTYELSGRQIEQLLQAINSEEHHITLMRRQFSILEQIYAEIFSLDKVLELPAIFNASEFVVQTNLPFNYLSDIIKFDKYAFSKVKFTEKVIFDILLEDDRTYYRLTDSEWEQFIELIQH